MVPSQQIPLNPRTTPTWPRSLSDADPSCDSGPAPPDLTTNIFEAVHEKISENFAFAHRIAGALWDVEAVSAPKPKKQKKGAPMELLSLDRAKNIPSDPPAKRNKRHLRNVIIGGAKP
jgi:hypothetical protein